MKLWILKFERLIISNKRWKGLRDSCFWREVNVTSFFALFRIPAMIKRLSKKYFISRWFYSTKGIKDVSVIIINQEWGFEISMLDQIWIKTVFLKIYIFKFSPPQLSWDEKSISPRICNFWCNFVSRLRTLYPLVTFNANFNGFTRKKLFVTICLYAEKSSSIGLTQITN